MALGTNYRRNQSREDGAISRRIANAMEIARQLEIETGCTTEIAENLGARIVLGRLSKEEAIKELLST